MNVNIMMARGLSTVLDIGKADLCVFHVTSIIWYRLLITKQEIALLVAVHLKIMFNMQERQADTARCQSYTKVV
jgi:hypothetical protein